MRRTYSSLGTDDLRYTCPPDSIPWRTTDEAPSLGNMVGQERALRAIDFGLRMDSRGYNLFLLGETGCGKSSTISSLIHERAATEPLPEDWAYLHNFRDPRKPSAISFPPGKGHLLAVQMRDLVEVLKKNIPKALEDKEFEARRGEVIARTGRENAGALADFQKLAAETGFALEKSDDEYSFVPLKDGKKLSEEDFEALPAGERERFEERIRQIRGQFKEVGRTIRRREEETRHTIENMTREQVKNTVKPLVEAIAASHPDNQKLGAHLDDLLADILDNYTDFMASASERFIMPGIKISTSEPSTTRYEVNLIVDRSGQQGAPVVTEPNPTFYNLIGKMEHSIQFGMALTNFTHIQPGALHQANGGYLILDALEVLRSPFAWETLKTCLKSGVIRIEDLGEQYRLFSTASIRPEPIPLRVKVALVGTPMIYYLLLSLDQDFTRLFKVKADFGHSMKRTEQAVRDYALFVATSCRRENLLPFDDTAVAAVVEIGARLAGDKERVTTRFSQVADLVREASFWATEGGASRVARDHVLQADREKIHRHNRIEERVGELMEEGTIFVQTSGGIEGQVNGISFYDLGDYGFAKPTRLTAKVFPGKGGMINIEREVKLSGSIHSKGVLIVASYLAMRYTRDFPLSLSGAVTFEQTYEEVEGDSATVAEVVALVSALARVPVRQELAVTGSMDQHGRVQPVGGINEKIEGFFSTCSARGLTGSQGVVIPASNVRNLMLPEEVILAVREGRFSIFAADHVDEVLEIMTGQAAGERDGDGVFPEGTLNRMAEDRLREMAEMMRSYDGVFLEGEGEGEEDQDPGDRSQEPGD